jgi:hypothetical protein
VVVSAVDGTVRYDWTASDILAAGALGAERQLLVWWEITTTAGGKTQDYAEALILVVAHSNAQVYVELEQLKASAELTGTIFADADGRAALRAASRAIDGECQRRFYPDRDATQIRYYSPARAGYLRIDDLVTLTSLQTDPGGDGSFEETWAATDYVLEPLNAAADGWPWTRIRAHPAGNYEFPVDYPKTVKLTGKFGWAAVPAPIQDAVAILAARLVKRKREAPLGVVQIGVDLAGRIAKNDPDVQSLIAPYRRLAP